MIYKGPFWDRVQFGPVCWLWRGPKTKDGYGRHGHNHVLAHRIAFAMFEPIPAGLHVLHLCDNPSCVRPDHLTLGTQAANNLDRHTKGRTKGIGASFPIHPATMRAGEKHWLSKVTDADARAMLKLAKAGATQAHIAARYGVSKATVKRALKRAVR